MFNKLFAVGIVLVLIFFSVSTAYAQEATPTPTPTSSSQASNIQDCKDNNVSVADCPAFLQKKLSELQGQGKTLSSQISAADTQIKLTEAKIESTEVQIEKLSEDIDITKTKISSSEGDLERTSFAFLGRAKAVYQVGTVDPWQLLLTASTLDNFFTRLKYLKIVQLFDKRNIYAAEQAKVNYENQQEILEDKKSEQEVLGAKLEVYTDQLNEEKAAKKKLLDETKGSEANYQKLLSAAKAQLAGFSNFVTSQGGASILPPQPSPDGWYYNQRDERWGNNSIGVSGEPVWKYGCLLTSMAMVLKKNGDNVTPADMAGNSSYYFADTAYMLIPWGGGKFTSIWQKDFGAIDSKLASGKPVIVGLYAGQYGTHFIVLKSGSNGDYIMNDPWYGPDLPFTSHYNKDQIFQYGYLN